MSKISRRSVLLLVFDMAAVSFSYWMSAFIYSGRFDASLAPFLLFALVVFPLIFYIFDLYYPFKYFTLVQTFVDVLIAVGTGSMILAAFSYFNKIFILPRYVFLYTVGTLIFFVYVGRIFYDFVFRSRFLDKRTLILGTGLLACEIAKIVKETPHTSIEVIGLVYEHKKPSFDRKSGIPIVGGMPGLISLIDKHSIQLVILALDPNEEVAEASVMQELLKRRILVTSSIHLFEKLTGDVPYRLLGNHYLLGLMAQVKTRSYLHLKRIVDILLSLVLLVVLSPVFLLTAFVMFLTGPGRVFFIQERIGKDGAPFRLFKFRSMTERKGKQKVTLVGKLMRRYRIDELPQLVNVLKGDMSLVGPRPEIPYFVERSRKKIPFYDAVFALKPGLTGWAQVKFRYAVSVKDYDQKFRYNLYYLKNISLALDLLIILQTIRVVILGKGK